MVDKKEFIKTADQRLNEKELDLDVFNFPIAIFSFFKSMADVKAWEKQADRFNARRIFNYFNNLFFLAVLSRDLLQILLSSF